MCTSAASVGDTYTFDASTTNDGEQLKENFTVPTGVEEVRIISLGAQGGSPSVCSGWFCGFGGSGANATVYYDQFSDGDILTVWAGGQGLNPSDGTGYADGGFGGSGNNDAGGGGGSSAVVKYSNSNLIVEAGGGGGGGTSRQDGGTNYCYSGGGGGSGGSGGSTGSFCSGGGTTDAGNDGEGSRGTGGDGGGAYYDGSGDGTAGTSFFGSNIINSTSTSGVNPNPGKVTITVTEVNQPPNSPTLNSPADGASVSTSVTLDVTVSDPESDSMDVSFYWSNGTLITTKTGVSSGSSTSTTVSGLNYQTYNWYVVADDGINSTQSSTWSFTVEDNTAPSISNLAPFGRLNDRTPVISFDASDNDQLSSYRIELDTIEVDSGSLSGSSDSASFTVPKPLIYGSHGYTVYVTDASGNTQSTSGSFIVNRPPELFSIDRSSRFFRPEQKPSYTLNVTDRDLRLNGNNGSYVGETLYDGEIVNYTGYKEKNEDIGLTLGPEAEEEHVDVSDINQNVDPTDTWAFSAKLECNNAADRTNIAFQDNNPRLVRDWYTCSETKIWWEDEQGNAYPNAAYTNNWQDNEVHKVAYFYDGQEGHVIIDGQEVVTQNIGDVDPAAITDLVIGDGYESELDGTIYNFYIWSDPNFGVQGIQNFHAGSDFPFRPDLAYRFESESDTTSYETHHRVGQNDDAINDGGVTFDGVDDVVSFQDQTIDTTASDYSVSTKFQISGGDSHFIYGRFPDFGIRINNGGVNSWHNGYAGNIGSGLEDGQNHTVTVNWDTSENQKEIWIDGDFVANDQSWNNDFSFTNTFYMGDSSNWNSYDVSTNGTIYYVNFYDRTLTGSEVTELGDNPMSVQDGLVSSYDFENATGIASDRGKTILDYSPVLKSILNSGIVGDVLPSDIISVPDKFESVIVKFNEYAEIPYNLVTSTTTNVFDFTDQDSLLTQFTEDVPVTYERPDVSLDSPSDGATVENPPTFTFTPDCNQPADNTVTCERAELYVNYTGEKNNTYVNQWAEDFRTGTFSSTEEGTGDYSSSDSVRLGRNYVIGELGARYWTGPHTHPGGAYAFDITQEEDMTYQGDRIFTMGSTPGINWGSSFADTRPSYLPEDEYSWLAYGDIYIPETGVYTFGIDSDDASDLRIDGEFVVGWYGGHGVANNFKDHSTDIRLEKGWHDFEARMEEISGGDQLAVGWKKPGDTSFNVIPSKYYGRVEEGSADRYTHIDTFSQPDEWRKVNLNNSYQDPAVFATANTENGDDSSKLAKIRNVGNTSFEAKVCEHEDTDGGCDPHDPEEIGYVAIDLAKWDSYSGVETGTVTLSGGDVGSSTTVNFDSSLADPAIIAEQQTYNEAGESIVQAVNVGSSSADLYLCDHDENAVDGCESHGNEEVAWIAFDKNIVGAVRPEVDVGEATSISNSIWTSQSFSKTFNEPPAVISTIQTNNGNQQAKPTMARSVTTTGMEVRYCEHDNADVCDDHNAEDVAWMALPREDWIGDDFYSTGTYTKTVSNSDAVDWGGSSITSDQTSGSISVEYGENTSGSYTYYNDISSVPNSKYLRTRFSFSASTYGEESPTLNKFNVWGFTSNKKVFQKVAVDKSIGSGTQDSITYNLSDKFTSGPGTFDWTINVVQSDGQESIDASDTTNKTVDVYRNFRKDVQQSTNTNTDTSRQSELNRDSTQSTSVTGRSNRNISVNRTISVSLDITSSVKAVEEAIVNVASAISLSSRASRSVELGREVNQEVNSDTRAERKIEVDREVKEISQIAEVTEEVAEKVRQVSDNININESVNKQIPLRVRRVTQNVNSTSETSRSIDVSRTVEQSSRVGETISRTSEFYRNSKQKVLVKEETSRTTRFFRGVIEKISLFTGISSNSKPNIYNATVQVRNLSNSASDDPADIYIRLNIRDQNNDLSKVSIDGLSASISGSSSTVLFDVSDDTDNMFAAKATDSVGATGTRVISYSITSNSYNQTSGNYNITVQRVNKSDKIQNTGSDPYNINISQQGYNQKVVEGGEFEYYLKSGESYIFNSTFTGDFLNEQKQWHTRSDEYNTVYNQSIAQTLNITSRIKGLTWTKISTLDTQTPQIFNPCDSCGSTNITFKNSYSNLQQWTDTGDGINNKFVQDLADVVIGDRDEWWKQYRYNNITSEVRFRDIWANTTINENNTEDFTSPFIRVESDSTFNNTIKPKVSSTCSTENPKTNSVQFGGEEWRACVQDIDQSGKTEYFKLQIPSFSQHQVRYGLRPPEAERFIYRLGDPCPRDRSLLNPVLSKGEIPGSNLVGKNDTYVCFRQEVQRQKEAVLESRPVERQVAFAVVGLILLVGLAIVVILIFQREEDGEFKLNDL